MKAIAMIDRNYGIGKDNELLIRDKRDMRIFKAYTTNKVVVMGRKTMESVGKPLLNRLNVVLTTDLSIPLKYKEGYIFVYSVNDLFNYLHQHNIHTDDVIVIGGEKIYELLLPYCTELMISKINRSFDANKFFPYISDYEFELTGRRTISEDITLCKFSRRKGNINYSKPCCTTSISYIDGIQIQSQYCNFMHILINR